MEGWRGGVRVRRTGECGGPSAAPQDDGERQATATARSIGGPLLAIFVGFARSASRPARSGHALYVDVSFVNNARYWINARAFQYQDNQISKTANGMPSFGRLLALSCATFDAWFGLLSNRRRLKSRARVGELPVMIPDPAAFIGSNPIHTA